MPVALAEPGLPTLNLECGALDGPEEVEVLVISPHLAATWLKKYNVDNFRPLSDKHRDKYVKAIKGGKFPLSNAMIILCKDRITGKILLGDGQHRLAACVEADMPIRQVVLRNADPAIIIHADRGKGRKISDYLARMGHENPTVLAAALKILYTYKKNLDSIANPKGDDDDLYAMLSDRPDLVPAVNWAVSATARGRGVRMSPSWLAVARTLIMEVSGLPECNDPKKAREDADFFFARMVDDDRQEMQTSMHPIVQLNQILASRGNHVRDTQDKLAHFLALAYVIKAWNKYRIGDHGHNLVVRLGGRAPEPFPRPI